MTVTFDRIELPRDQGDLVELLTRDEWPFHGRRRLDAGMVGRIDFSSSDVESYWIVDGERVGLIRLFDLDDIGEGAPQFDLRIASRYRGHGYGTIATTWLVLHLFSSYPTMHRIEASTRDDNAAMQRVLTIAGFRQEGRLRSSWWWEDGSWFDTLVYGILREEMEVGIDNDTDKGPSRSI